MPPRIGSRPAQPAAAAGHVDLGDVAGDDGLRAEADAGEEHLHLLGRGVLRLVEDDEAVVERAAAHERQRRDLDRAALEQALRALGLDHVVERVVERAQVRVDLGHEVAGQEAEPLAGLDRGPGEDDAVDLLGLQRLHRHRHRELALAGAGRADAEGDDVVARWRRRSASGRSSSGRTVRPCGRAQHLGGEHLGRALVGLHHVDGAADTSPASSAWPCSSSSDQLLEEPADPLGVGARRW